MWALQSGGLFSHWLKHTLRRSSPSASSCLASKNLDRSMGFGAGLLAVMATGVEQRSIQNVKGDEAGGVRNSSIQTSRAMNQFLFKTTG